VGPVLAAVLAITKRRYLQQQKQMPGCFAYAASSQRTHRRPRLQACGPFLAAKTRRGCTW
jgi:hypothetical protein